MLLIKSFFSVLDENDLGLKMFPKLFSSLLFIDDFMNFICCQRLVLQREKDFEDISTEKELSHH